MKATKIDGNDIKHRLGQKGMNLTTFSEQFGFRYRLVSDVVRGMNLGKYGKDREILEKLNEVIAEDTDNTNPSSNH